MLSYAAGLAFAWCRALWLVGWERHELARMRMSQVFARRAYSLRSWTPSPTRTRRVRQRPPELAGRDEQLRTFDVVLERISRGRSERSIVLTGLRGVGKTVLLNALRSSAVRADWAWRSRRGPINGCAGRWRLLPTEAVRELGHPRGDEVDHVLGIIKSFALRMPPGAKLRDRWQPGIDVPAVSGRADSGDIEIDLVELFTDIGGLAADGKGVAFFIDEMQDLDPEDVSALCASCHEISQTGPP